MLSLRFFNQKFGQASTRSSRNCLSRFHFFAAHGRSLSPLRSRFQRRVGAGRVFRWVRGSSQSRARRPLRTPGAPANAHDGSLEDHTRDDGVRAEADGQHDPRADGAWTQIARRERSCRICASSTFFAEEGGDLGDARAVATRAPHDGPSRRRGLLTRCLPFSARAPPRTPAAPLGSRASLVMKNRAGPDAEDGGFDGRRRHAPRRGRADEEHDRR